MPSDFEGGIGTFNNVLILKHQQNAPSKLGCQVERYYLANTLYPLRMKTFVHADQGNDLLLRIRTSLEAFLFISWNFVKKLSDELLMRWVWSYRSINSTFCLLLIGIGIYWQDYKALSKLIYLSLSLFFYCSTEVLISVLLLPILWALEVIGLIDFLSYPRKEGLY